MYKGELNPEISLNKLFRLGEVILELKFACDFDK